MVVLGESSVALEEDILKAKVEFVRDEKEFSSRSREFFFKSDESGGTRTLIDVGANRVFFLTSCWISATNGAATSEQGFITTEQADVDHVLLGVAAEAGSSQSNSLSFTMPIRIDSGQLITLESTTASMRVFGGITGWIEDKRIS